MLRPRVPTGGRRARQLPNSKRTRPVTSPPGAGPPPRFRGHDSEEFLPCTEASRILIGRLVTDEDFRAAFQRDPVTALANASAWGLELSAGEVGALLATERTLWDRVALELDSRLQKASLRTGPSSEVS